MYEMTPYRRNRLKNKKTLSIDDIKEGIEKFKNFSYYIPFDSWSVFLWMVIKGRFPSRYEIYKQLLYITQEEADEFRKWQHRNKINLLEHCKKHNETASKEEQYQIWFINPVNIEQEEDMRRLLEERNELREMRRDYHRERRDRFDALTDGMYGSYDDIFPDIFE